MSAPSSASLLLAGDSAHTSPTSAQQLQAQLLPHPKRDSICVPKSEPQTSGSSSVSTVEHMRGASDEKTLWYIYKSTEIDWKCMLGGRNKGEKSSLSPGSDLQDHAALGNKIKISQTCKHFSVNCWSHRFLFSHFLWAVRRKQAGHHHVTTE